MKNSLPVMIIAGLLLFTSVFWSCATGNTYDKKALYILFSELRNLTSQDGFSRDLPESMRIISLSILSDGLNNYARIDGSHKKDIAGLLDTIARDIFTQDFNPYNDPVFYNTLDTDEHNLFLSHANIILSNYHAVTGDTAYRSIQEKINNHLRTNINRNTNWKLASFPGSTLVFPADLAAMAYSLWLYDTVNGIKRDDDIPGRFLDFLKTGATNPEFELPVSEISGDTWYSPYPRGCATAFLIYYVHFFGSNESGLWWKMHNRAFRETFLSLTVYREWITDTKNIAYTAALEKWKKKYGVMGDADTGPMLGEYGSAATGLSLLAGAAVGDTVICDSIKRAIGEGKKLLENANPEYRKYSENILTKSIVFASETQ